MKVYQLTEKDFQQLIDKLDKDPAHGYMGGGSGPLSVEERRIYTEAHRHYNYQIRTWISKVKEE